MPKLHYLITNMFTGEDEPVTFRVTPEGPTQWWVNGWNAGMDHGPGDLPANPYPPHTTEWWEWADGFAAAEAD